MLLVLYTHKLKRTKIQLVERPGQVQPIPLARQLTKIQPVERPGQVQQILPEPRLTKIQPVELPGQRSDSLC